MSAEPITQCHSTTLGKLAKALAAAQAELNDAKKDSFNPHFKNKFASLSSVRAELQRVLPKHGLATLQTTTPHGDAGVCVVTWLLHESGEWIRGELFLPVGKKDPQGFGSALSYARRYALAAIVGISSDEDDDAEVAARPTNTNGKPANGKPEVAKADEPTEDEKSLEFGYYEAISTEAIAKIDVDAAAAVKAGKVSAQGRTRLLQARAKAVTALEQQRSAS